MGIETTLTIVLAAAILVAAVVLRVVVIGLYRLGLVVWKNLHGPTGEHRVPRIEPALERVRGKVAERTARVAAGAGTLAQYLAALGADAARATSRHARAAARWTRPRALATYERGRAETITFYRWMCAETEDAYSGERGRTTYQAIGETATTWGGHPHVVLTPH